ncbi:MAG: DUF4202 domain-containing protein [Acidobacteriota bacterium]|nr:DUF4202 domain-containing protein [Acidobacteriota bacterium]
MKSFELMPRFQNAVAGFDLFHREDPATATLDGEQVPRELAYSRRMAAWVERLDPEAGEILLLAAHCQHLRRFSLPRTDYPEGRKGYLVWRRAAALEHARLAGAVLRDAGYRREKIERVQNLVLKRAGRSARAEAQTLEDAACLVFLEHDLEALAGRLGPDRTAVVLARTWPKMSAGGREAAAGLELKPELRELVDRAVDGR